MPRPAQVAPAHAVSGRATAASAAAVLAAAAVWVAWEPWHGPIVLNLSSGHGIPTGDLVALPVVALAVWIALTRSTMPGVTRRPAGGVSTRTGVGPASAAAVGALLLVVGIVDLADHGPLVPAGGGTFDGGVLSVAGRSANPVREWTHVALTHDGTTLRLFVDGRLESSREVSGATPATGNPLWIGGNRPYGERFDGLIDEVRVYDRALDAAAIRSDMAAPVAARPPGRRAGARPAGRAVAQPAAAYSFDAVTGGSVADLSGNGNAGTVIGATWTARGRYGGALRFDGADDAVEVPGSGSLDLGPALTLSAWVRPASPQAGWRTILHRERDAYFLTASSGLEGLTGPADDLLAGVVVAAAAASAAVTVVTRGRWLGERRRSWAIAVAALLAGFAVDAAASPSATLFGPLVLAGWFAATARDRVEAVAGWLVAAGLAAATAASLADLAGVGVRMERDDGGLARSAALGVTLVVIGLATLRSGRRGRATPG